MIFVFLKYISCHVSGFKKKHRQRLCQDQLSFTLQVFRRKQSCYRLEFLNSYLMEFCDHSLCVKLVSKLTRYLFSLQMCHFILFTLKGSQIELHEFVRRILPSSISSARIKEYNYLPDDRQFCDRTELWVAKERRQALPECLNV